MPFYFVIVLTVYWCVCASLPLITQASRNQNRFEAKFYNHIYILGRNIYCNTLSSFLICKFCTVEKRKNKNTVCT